MKANLAQREPVFVEKWAHENLYAQLLKKNAGKPWFVLHDGPPYANGNIHLGHVMNKTLKDIVVKSKTMSGLLSPYIPGWDCHGLPIEHQVVKKLGPKAKTLSKSELRKECRKYAEHFIDIQRSEFQRLGIFGEWENPYRTMDFSYQAQVAREFGKVVEGGYVYRRRKPVYWCMSCRTALAEAEIEYADHRSPSIYVAYPVLEGWEGIGLPATPLSERFALIWTTTPWTLPASMAIAFNPKLEYVVIERKGKPGRFLVAKELVSQISERLKIDLHEVGRVKKAEELTQLHAEHPFIPLTQREIRFYPGEHVTLEGGTGLVHTAPGHGEEDYELGLRHHLDVYSPVEEDGKFESGVEHFAQLPIFEANPKIIQHLKDRGRLFEHEQEISHPYPHCWRCRNPVIFRATAQWFLSMSHNDLREKALYEIDQVKWIPKWGRERIHGMISTRPDWCLSRQRVWGVPLIAFTCRSCNENLLSPAVIHHVADLFEEKGADIWFESDVRALLPEGTECSKCGAKDFEKGNDILDVWFDSGASHAAVLEKRNLSWPCDLYLEGSDQHRGWFHSTLLEAMATRKDAPYKTVLTHGFVVDGEGKKMSKSLGNYVSAQDLVKERGAEMLRLWVATEDYRDDVRFSKEIMDRVVESYRRIRNTARFCLSNLFDFSPDSDRVALKELNREVDRWAANRLARLMARLIRAYHEYNFHFIVQSLNEFCVVDLSARYLDISKDTLYCDEAGGKRRRSAQTVLFDVVRNLATVLAPLLPMTAEEIWEHIPSFRGKALSVHLTDFPAPPVLAEDDFDQEWEKLFILRSEVSKVLERLRQKKVIGQSLEASVELSASEDEKKLFKKHENDLPMLFIVSRVKLVDRVSSSLEVLPSDLVAGFTVGAKKVEGVRCERCWTYALDLGVNPKHTALCGRCARVVETI